MAALRQTLQQLRRQPLPQDYLSEARTSPELWPERILCFTRKTLLGAEAEPPRRHHHHRYVLAVPWQGRGRFDVDESQYPLSPGNALLILPFQFHHLHHFERQPTLWQIITFELRVPATLEPMALQPWRKVDARALEFLAAFTRAWSERKTGELAPWLSLVLDRLRHASPARHSRSERNSIRHAAENSLMATINRQCLPRLEEIVGLKDLAARVGISESHLRARFREETGISLGRHVRRLRLQKAMGLLAQSALSVGEIAERCGFDTVFTFSRSFRQMAGLSATDYRRRTSIEKGKQSIVTGMASRQRAPHTLSKISL